MITSLNEFDYLNQIHNGDYDELPNSLFDFIATEGWLVSLEDEHKTEYTSDDFEYLTLNLTSEDKNGLMVFDENTIEKFNKLDLNLKSEQEYPFDTLDFIDYEKGIVYIIRLI